MEKVEGIILAAGFSSRASSYKMALSLGGRPLIHWTIEAMAAVCSRIVAVGGYHFKELRGLCVDFPAVSVVENSAYQEGMFSSVRKGVSCINSERFFLIPGDMPFVDRSVYRSLLAASGRIIIPAFNGKKGHPVLFERSFIPGILGCSPDSTLKDFINKKNCTILDVTDRGILLDIDTDEDLRQYAEEYFG